MAFVVVYDACVLYPAPLRDLLVRVARTGLVRARWSDAILDECFRPILENRPELNPRALERTRMLMKLIRALLPDEVAEVLDVRIEYAPGPNREYLDDRTSFDAFFGYRRIDGKGAFLAIETKLTESFTTTRYSRPRYLELTEREDSLWRRAAWSVLSSSETNQLWRNYLLVEAVRTHPENPHGIAGRSVVVRHPADQDCAGAVENYRALLVAPDATFADWTLDYVIRTWKAASRSAAELSWMVAFERRYIDLSAGASIQ